MSFRTLLFLPCNIGFGNYSISIYIHTDLLISFKQLCNIPLYVVLVGTSAVSSFFLLIIMLPGMFFFFYFGTLYVIHRLNMYMFT